MAQQMKFGPQVERLHAVAGSPAGRLVAIGGEREGLATSQVHVLQLPSGAAVLSASVDAPVHALRFLADDLLCAGSARGTLFAWDAGAEKPSAEAMLAIEGAHAGAIRALATDPTGKHLVSAGDDGVVRAFALEVSGGKPKLVARGERRLSARPLRAAELDPVSQAVVAAGDDGVIRTLPLASLATAAPREMPCGEGGVFTLALSGDGRVAAGCGDGSVRLCYLEGATDEDNRSGEAAHTAPVRGLVFGPLLRDEAGRELQRRLLSVGEDGQLKAWLLEQRRKPRSLELGSSPVHALAWLPAPSHAKAESRGGTLAAVNKRRELLLVTLGQESEPAESVRRLGSELARLEEELGAKSVDVRRAAVEALAPLPEDDARLLLDRALSDRDPAVRKLAAESMGRSGRRLSRPALRKALDDDQKPVREAALEALEALERDRPLQPIRSALGSKHADLRLAAVRRLPALRGASPLVPGLIASTLSDLSPEVRAGAFAALLELEPAGSLGPLRTAIERGPADVRAMAVARLTRPELASQPAARQLLESALDDGEGVVRGIAFVAALATRPRLSSRVRQVDPATAKALDDYKAQGLCELSAAGDPTEEDLQPLFAALGCRHADTALRGARMLALLGDGRAAGALLQLSREEDAETRRYVVEALYVGAWTLKDDRLRARIEWLLDDPDAQVRTWAMSTLEKLAEPDGDEGALRIAETALRCANEDMRVRALQILVQFGGDGQRGKAQPALRAKADELLGQALDDEHADARKEAFRTLWAWHAREPRVPCARGAASRHADIRVQVVGELARIVESWADELLVALCEDSAAEVGLAAYAALTDDEKHKARAATQAKRPEVQLAALRSPRPEVRAAGCRGASRQLALAKALRTRLCELIREDNPVVHVAAIEAADRLIPDDQEAFAAAFASIFYNLRVRAAELCGKRRDVRAVEPMQLLLAIPKTDLNRPTDELRQRAARAVADVGDPGTIPFYVRLLDDEDAVVREMGARGLATACRPGEEQPLVAALAHADLPVRSWAAEGLARLGDERSLPVLAGTLKHEHPPIRRGAILSFVALGPDGVRGILQGLADPDRVVQDLVFATIVARDLALARAGLPPDLLLSALSSSHPEIRFAAARVLEARTTGEALFAAAQELCGPRRPEKASDMKDWPPERERPALLNVVVRALASDHPAQRYAAAQVLALKAQALAFWREAKRLAAPTAAERPWIPHTNWEDAKREPRKKGWLRRLFGKGGAPAPTAEGATATERVLAVLKYVGAPDPQPLPAAGEAIAAAEIKRLAFGTYAGLVRQAPATGEADETHRVRRDSIERLAALAADAEIGREAVLPLFRRALSDPHHLVRKAAMVGLRRLYGPDSLEPLALALESNAADVGRQAVDELCAAAAAGRADAGELARRALAISPNGEVRAHALGRLPRLYPEGSVDPWLLALDCPHPDVRLSVVDRLVDLRDERVTRALGQAMESSHEDLRLKAADALARRGDARTVDVLGTFLRSEDAGIWRRAVEALCALAHARPLDAAQADAAAAAAEVVARRIEDDPDKTADRAALLAALARIASPAADPVLIRLLADEQGAVRNDALRALLAIAKDRKQPAKVYPDGTLRERYDEELALRYLGEAAACTDVALRQLAAQHLADLDDNRAEALLARLTTDRDESVRVAACQRLAFRAERLETATTEPLSAALRTGRRELVLPAAAGLAARRRPEAFQALMLVLKAGEGAEREQAVLGLGSLGDRRALEELEPLVDPRAEVPDEDKVLAPVAAMALGMMIARLDDEEERRRVRETVERLVREGTPAVRQKAIAGLRLAGDDRSRALIERIATDRYEDASIRLTALTELGLLARAESEPALAQVLDDANVQLRKAALEALGRVIPEDRTRVALLALRSRYTDVSQPAASFLALRGDAATLVERLPEIESPEVRRRLRQGLVRRGDRPSDALRRLLEGGRAEARAEAAWVAGASGDAALSESVLAAVERSAAGWREARTRLAGATRGSDDRELNANVEAWRAGLWAAARLGAPAVDQARRALEKDAPPVVQRQALRFLSLHGGTKVQLAELEVCLASPDRGVRMAAAAALAALSPGEGRTVLRVIRELPAVDAAAVAPMVQTALASAGQELLGSDAGRRVALPILIGSRRTAELTAIALASGADPARLVAIAALGRIGGEEADSALGQILTRGDAEDEAVRREAFRALRRLRRAAAKRFVEGKDKEKRGGGWGGGGEDDEGDEDDGGDEEGGGEDDLEDAGDDGDDGDGGDDDGDYDEDDEGDEGDEGDEDDEDDED